MAQETMERRVQDLEGRLTTAEQFLPTLATRAQTKADIEAAAAPLATKAELEAAVAPLATRDEVRAEIQAAIEAAIAPLATKAEVRAEIQAEGIETRRHFDVVAEGMHADIRMLAEGVVTTQARCDTRHRDVTGTLTQHDRRITRVETSRSKRR